MNLSIDELKEALLNAELVDLFQKAYKQGVEDGRDLEKAKFENSLPPNLKKEDVAKVFNCESATVEKIIRMDGFPRCPALKARYPRDKVLEWRDKNTMYMNSRLGIFVSENEKLRLLRA